MKKYSALVLMVSFLLAMACSGSDTYRGEWKAKDGEGNKYEITFHENSIDVRDSTGENTKFEYSQNSVGIKNSIKTYGIKLGDGRMYQIHFPIANDDSKAIIRDENENPLYIISRTQYLNAEDIYKLK